MSPLLPLLLALLVAAGPGPASASRLGRFLQASGVGPALDDAYSGDVFVESAGAYGSTWACTTQDDSSSCCGVVPAFFALFNSTPCSQFTPIIALALGIDTAELPASFFVPGAATTLAQGDIAAAVSSYCPSGCALDVGTLIASTVASRPASGHLCPQVFDGLWRLQLACASDASGSLCLADYAAIGAAFDTSVADRETLLASSSALDSVCSAPCTRIIMDMAVTQAAVFGAALALAAPGSDTAALLEYAERRASSLTRMIDLLCTADANGDYCVLSSGLLMRSVGPPLSDPLPSARLLHNDATPLDSFAELLDPRLRPGFACSFCGRVLIAAVLDLSDLFGAALPTAVSTLSVARTRVLLEGGCAVAHNRTCLQMLSDSNPASPSYDKTLGSAAAALQGLCANDLANNLGNGCSASCTAALAEARDAFGCCFEQLLTMQLALGSFSTGTCVPHAVTVNAQSRCGVSFDTFTCHATYERFVAILFGTVPFTFASSHGPALGAALDQDLATMTGLSALAFSFVSLLSGPPASSGASGSVFVIGLVAPNDAASHAVIAQIRQRTSNNTASFPYFAAALLSAGSPAYAAPLTSADVSEASAPAPAPVPTPSAPASGAAAAAAVATSVSLALAAAAALVAFA